MIQIIPAISVLYNKVARLENHDLNDVVLYNDTPLEMATKLEDHGIKRIYLLDIEGARQGSIKNTDTLETIAGFTDLEVDFGGGVNYDDHVRLAFECGATRVHVASIAIKDPEVLSSWLISFGRNKLILSADVLDDKVATRDMINKTEIDLMEMLDNFHVNGMLHVKISDAKRDGKLQGPALELYKKIKKEFPEINLIASGGVRTIEDIKALEDIGVDSVIIARAIYDGKIELKELERFLK
jgi:phosphoribosylformimino-5-aminoimidazole carboxamide ribotide isomerase